MGINIKQEYIVTKKQILDAVRYGLEEVFKNTPLINLVMKPIEREIKEVLENDCDEMTEEMWERLSL